MARDFSDLLFGFGFDLGGLTVLLTIAVPLVSLTETHL